MKQPRPLEYRGNAAPARGAALDALFALEQNSALGSGEALDQAILRYRLDSRDARLATTIVFGVLRHAAWLDLQYESFLRQPPDRLDPGLRILMRMAACQKFLLERVPPHAIASDTVELAKSALRMSSHQAGFVNAIVRRILSLPEPIQPEGEELERVAVRHSHPVWLVTLLQAKFGSDHLQQILQFNNTEAPTTLRVNRLTQGTREHLAQQLALEGIETAPGELSPDALLLTDTGRLRDLLASPLFECGGFYLQDEASQAVALLVAPKQGESILDLCAAPGGKATHLAELSQGKARVLATDVSSPRLDLVRENSRRLRTPGLEVIPFAEVEALLEKPESGRLFDAVLIDAPCSGLGTIRRNPEIRDRVTSGSLKRLSKQQSKILADASNLVKPGGRLVYSTCTVSDEENRRVIDRFLASHPEFSLGASTAPEPPLQNLLHADGLYRTWPRHLGVDGFEAAVLWRKG